MKSRTMRRPISRPSKLLGERAQQVTVETGGRLKAAGTCGVVDELRVYVAPLILDSAPSSRSLNHLPRRGLRPRSTRGVGRMAHHRADERCSRASSPPSDGSRCQRRAMGCGYASRRRARHVTCRGRLDRGAGRLPHGGGDDATVSRRISGYAAVTAAEGREVNLRSRWLGDRSTGISWRACGRRGRRWRLEELGEARGPHRRAGGSRASSREGSIAVDAA